MDHLATLTEAVRRTQAKVAFYLEPGRDPYKGLQEIGFILEDETLRGVMDAISCSHQRTSLVPEEPLDQIAPASPLSR